MDHTDNRITLYTSQADIVLDTLKRDGVCFSKAEYVRKKYGESAPIFLTAYDWFVRQADKIVPKPEGAEFPYWAFQDLYSLEQSGESHTLTLLAPVDQVILFDMYDWNKIMCMRYIGENEKEEKAFHQELDQRGLKESDVMLTQFYPEWRQEIIQSWSRLFRHHEKIKNGDNSDVGSVQAAVWQIREEWIIDGFMKR